MTSIRRSIPQWPLYAAAALIFAAPALARAESSCVKDSDCPGQLVCEAGACSALGSGGEPVPASPAPAGEAQPAPAPAAGPAQPGSVFVRFQLPNSADRWSLVGPDGQFLCSLPCERHVAPHSGLTLRSARQDDTLQLAVPDNLPLSASVQVTPRRSGSKVGPVLLLSIGGAEALLSLAAASACPSPQSDEAYGSSTDSDDSCVPTFAVLGSFGVAAAVTGLIWLIASPGPRVKVESTAGSSGSVRLRPGFVEMNFGGGAKMALSPAGVLGVF